MLECFNSSMVRFGEAQLQQIANAESRFNSSMVRFGVKKDGAKKRFSGSFNSSMVRFGEKRVGFTEAAKSVSIPVWCDLEGHN